MVFLICVCAALFGGIGIFIYLHFSEKEEYYDPDKASIERDNEAKRAEIDYRTKKESIRNSNIFHH